jgi:hypothetical protein
MLIIGSKRLFRPISSDSIACVPSQLGSGKMHVCPGVLESPDAIQLHLISLHPWICPGHDAKVKLT